MPPSQDPVFFAAQNDCSLIIARTSGKGRSVVVEELREVALSEKSAIETALREVFPAGSASVSAAAIRPVEVLHLATADESKRHAAPAAVQKFARESAKFSSLQPGFFAVAPAKEGAAAPWLLVATAGAAHAQALTTLGERQIKPSRTAAASLHAANAIVSTLKTRGTDAAILCLDLGATESHALLISRHGIEAAGPAAISLDSIAEAVQAELGLKFKGSAGKLFFNELYDFTEAGPKIAARLAPAVKASLANLGNPAPKELYFAGLPAKQQWLAQLLATELGLAAYAPDVKAWCASLGLTFANPSAETSPAWLGFLHFVSVQSGGTPGAAWSSEWASFDSVPVPAPAPAPVPAQAAPPAPTPVATAAASASKPAPAPAPTVPAAPTTPSNTKAGATPAAPAPVTKPAAPVPAPAQKAATPPPAKPGATPVKPTVATTATPPIKPANVPPAKTAPASAAKPAASTSYPPKAVPAPAKAAPPAPPPAKPTSLPAAALTKVSSGTNPPRVTAAIPVPAAVPRRPEPSGKGKWGLIIGIAAIIAVLVGGYLYMESQKAKAERDRVAAAELQAANEKRIKEEAEAARLVAEQKARAEAEARRKTELEFTQKLAEAEAARQRAEATAKEQAAARLANARGTAVIRTEPAGAMVTVGGLPPRPAPATFDLRIGKYPVTVSLQHHDSSNFEVEINENATTEPPVVRLARITGTIEVTSDPVGSNYEVRPANTVAAPPETRRSGQTPATLNDLPAGEYVVTITKQGWPTHTQNVTVGRNATARVAWAFQNGVVRISSTPEGAVITRNGTRIGVTPLTLSDQPAGNVRFDLSLAAHEPASVSGRVENGKTLSLSAPLLAVDRIALLSELDARPEVIPQSQVRPDVPDSLIQGGGRVVVEITVDRTGAVKEARVLESTNPALDRACLAAATKLRFKPATIGGKPMNIRVQIPYQFAPTK